MVTIHTSRDGHRRVFTTIPVIFGREELANAIILASKYCEELNKPSTRAKLIKMAKDTYRLCGEDAILVEIINNYEEWYPLALAVVDKLFPELRDILVKKEVQ
jgi:hypothetical protein